jgi:hypothetical protein
VGTGQADAEQAASFASSSAADEVEVAAMGGADGPGHPAGDGHRRRGGRGR